MVTRHKHDWCIRVFQVDLEYTTQQDRGHCFNHAINAKWLGVTFDAISFYYDLSFKGRVLLALDHHWYWKDAWSLCF